MKEKTKRDTLLVLGINLIIYFCYFITALVSYGLGWIEWTNYIWYTILLFIVTYILGRRIDKIKTRG